MQRALWLWLCRKGKTRYNAPPLVSIWWLNYFKKTKILVLQKIISYSANTIYCNMHGWMAGWLGPHGNLKKYTHACITTNIYIRSLLRWCHFGLNPLKLFEHGMASNSFLSVMLTWCWKLVKTFSSAHSKKPFWSCPTKQV